MGLFSGLTAIIMPPWLLTQYGSSPPVLFLPIKCCNTYLINMHWDLMPYFILFSYLSVMNKEDIFPYQGCGWGEGGGSHLIRCDVCFLYVSGVRGVFSALSCPRRGDHHAGDGPPKLSVWCERCRPECPHQGARKDSRRRKGNC